MTDLSVLVRTALQKFVMETKFRFKTLMNTDTRKLYY